MNSPTGRLGNLKCDSQQADILGSCKYPKPQFGNSFRSCLRRGTPSNFQKSPNRSLGIRSNPTFIESPTSRSKSPKPQFGDSFSSCLLRGTPSNFQNPP